MQNYSQIYIFPLHENLNLSCVHITTNQNIYNEAKFLKGKFLNFEHVQKLRAK